MRAYRIKQNKVVHPKRLVSIIPTYDKSNVMRIALVATGSWGDNINQTFQLKALKEKYPHCLIDVHTSNLYASAFYNNHYIYNLIEHQASDKNSALNLVHVIPPMLENSNYDLILKRHPVAYQPWSSPRHPEMGENLILVWAGQLDDLDIHYNVPLETSLFLTSKEVNRVREFISRVPNFSSSRNILMEVQAESGQTFWNHHWTDAVCRHFLTDPNTKLYISCRELSQQILELNKEYEGRVYFVGTLSIRECAELFNHCDIFQSISSGLSNACNTSWCKKNIKWFEVINSMAVSSAPMRKDDKVFWLDNNINNYISMLKSNAV